MTDEQRAERLYHHEYSTEGRVEQCERMRELGLVPEGLPTCE